MEKAIKRKSGSGNDNYQLISGYWLSKYNTETLLLCIIFSFLIIQIKISLFLNLFIYWNKNGFLVF